MDGLLILQRKLWVEKDFSKSNNQLALESSLKVFTLVNLGNSRDCYLNSKTFFDRASLFLGTFHIHLFHAVVQSLNCVWFSTPDFPLLHYFPEFAQTHVRWVSDAIQPSSAVPFSSRPQSFPASESFPMSQFFALGGQSIGPSHQSFQSTFRTDFL